jgi:hypothetical protein
LIRRQRRLWRRHANETTVEADTAVQESEEPADTVSADAEVRLSRNQRSLQIPAMLMLKVLKLLSIASKNMSTQKL